MRPASAMRPIVLLAVSLVWLWLVAPLAAGTPAKALPGDERRTVLYVEGSQGMKSQKSRVAGQVAGRHVGALTPTHDALFASTLSGAAPTSLLLIGTALAGVGLLVRRQLRRTGRLSGT